MKVKYTGSIVKTVNYDGDKYLYLIPKQEYTLSQNAFNSKRIQKLINETHELRVIEEPVKNIDIEKEMKEVPGKVEELVVKDTKKDKKKGRKNRKLKDVLNSLRKKKGGK